MIVVKAVAIWAIVWFLSVNCVGLVLRGWFAHSEMVDAAAELNGIGLDGAGRSDVWFNVLMTLAGVAATSALLWWLVHRWNLIVASAAVLLIVARIPDLIWELRTGQTFSRKNSPQSWIHTASSILVYLALPLVWYGLNAAEV